MKIYLLFKVQYLKCEMQSAKYKSKKGNGNYYDEE